MIGKQKKVKAQKEKIPKKYNIVKAIVAGIVSVIFNVAIPIWISNGIENGNLLGMSLNQASMDGLITILDNVLLLSPLMIAFAVAATLFRKGDMRRMVVRSARGFFKIVWWLFITNMGHIENLILVDGLKADVILTGFFGFIILFAVIGCVMEYCDYKDYHEDYMDDCSTIAFHKGELPPERKDKEFSEEHRIGGRYE